MKLRSAPWFAATLLASAPLVSASWQSEPLTSGRPLPPEQAAFDVLHYDLSVQVFPREQRIAGSLTMRARGLAPSDSVLLDLDGHLTVAQVRSGGDSVGFRHENGEIRIDLAVEPEREFEVTVAYAGEPRVAPRPPWDGGFVWAETASGEPWIATANQMQGADLWWPCKDQPSDEPDSMDISVKVPNGLVCATNGRLVERSSEGGWTTFRWRVSTPINAYGVALNIAPYQRITTNYESVAGGTFPVSYWVLPENVEKGQELFRDILRQVRFFEETYGPYPFRADKYGVVETPHLGMEHQTITAYGNEYSGNPWGEDRGFDFLHHHEMAHEWWANLVTCRDWKDFWIHEGFATYAQALYVEKLHGPELYRAELRGYRGTLLNRGAVAPRETTSSAEVYFGAQSGDIYYKGSWILHTLRWVLGDEVFFRALRRMAYPDPALEKTTDGSACRFSDTEEIRAIAEEVSGVELGWFFELYLRQPALPKLEVSAGERLELAWRTPGDLPFPMPVEVRVGGRLTRVEMPNGTGSVELGGAEWEIDPNSWLLLEEDGANAGAEGDH